jgi:hypothetical protein
MPTVSSRSYPVATGWADGHMSGGGGQRPGLTPIEIARQAGLFCKAPASSTVEAIEKLTEKHVARTRRELLDKERPMIGERDQATAAALERLTRRIGILSLIPATQRIDLCRRMNLLKIRDECEPLFTQGQFCVDYYIPIVGAFECKATLHEHRFPSIDRQNIVAAGKSLHFEQGVGMPWEQGTCHREGVNAQCTSTAWPLFNEPKHLGKESKKASGLQKRLSITERRAAKRPGGMCIVLAIPMQDMLDVLHVQEDEVMLRGLALRKASDFFQEWSEMDLFSMVYMFDHHTYEPGQEIVTSGVTASHKLYILMSGKIDLQWVDKHHSGHIVASMPCDETMPCMGEHHVCAGYYDGAAPDYTASASKNSGPCEVLVCRSNDVLPYFDPHTKVRFLRVFQARRDRWFDLKAYHQGMQTRLSKPGSPTQHHSLDDSIESRMPAPGPTLFARFPPGLDAKVPSKLKYNGKELQAGGDVASEDCTPRVDKASPVPTEEYQRFTRVLPSTRTILRPQSIDDAGEAWKMSISSPYSGRKTFTAPSKYFGETDRKRSSRAPEKLPSLIDTNLFIEVCESACFFLNTGVALC